MGAHHHHNSNRASYCVCAHCGTAMRHVPGIPCNARKCPLCGSGTYKSYEEIPPQKLIKLENEEEEDFKHPIIQRAKKYPVVIPAQCTACGLCAEICPAHCISYFNGKALVDETNCRNCRICVEACPEKAFEIK